MPRPPDPYKMALCQRIAAMMGRQGEMIVPGYDGAMPVHYKATSDVERGSFINVTYYPEGQYPKHLTIIIKGEI